MKVLQVGIPAPAGAVGRVEPVAVHSQPGGSSSTSVICSEQASNRLLRPVGEGDAGRSDNIILRLVRRGRRVLLALHLRGGLAARGFF